MERVVENKGLKIVLIVLILLAMLSSYVPEISFASNEEIEYTKFTAEYTGGDSVLSGRDIGINYNFKLIGIQTGFQDVMLTVKDESEDTPTANVSVKARENSLNENTVVSNNGRYATIDFGNVRTGTDFSGVINVNFGKNPTYEDYEKEIVLVLTGKYNDPQNGVTDFTKELKLKANVHTGADVYPFKSYITTSFDRQRNTQIDYNSITNYNDFDVKTIKQKYFIYLDDENVTYSKIVISTSRTIPEAENLEVDSSEINTAENLKITAEAPTHKLFPNNYTKNIIRNSDGTTDIEFIRGAQSDEYSNQAIWGQSGSGIELTLEYKIVENSKGVDLEDVGNSVITTKIKGYEEGYNKSIDITGTTYTKGTYNQQRSYEEGYNIWSHVEGSDGYDYDLWNDGETKMDTDLAKEIKNGEISVITKTKVDADASSEGGRVKANLPENKLKITNYNKDNINVDSTKASKLTYEENSTEKTLDLSNLNMKVSDIQVRFEYDKLQEVKFYKKGDIVGVNEPFFIATPNNRTYHPLSNEVTEYYAVLGDILETTGSFDKISGTFNGYSTIATWQTTWEIDTSDLTAKMTEEQMKNIKSISRYQGGEYTLNTIELSPVCKDIATNFTESNEDKKWSYMEFDIGNYNAEKTGIPENKTLTLSMCKNGTVDSDLNQTIIKNENPIFYIKLSDMFLYSNITATCTTNPNIYIDSYGMENGYLVIKCKGTYDTSISGEKVDIHVNFNRVLNDSQASGTEKVEAFMITDNENYISSSYNSNNLQANDGSTPTKLYYASQNFTIEHTNKVQAISMLKKGMFQYIPDSSDDFSAWTEKTKPLALSDNRSATFIALLENSNKQLNNVNMILKLPVTENKSIKIYNDTVPYLLTEEGIVGLKNLQNVRVYTLRGNKKTLIPSSDYTIGYSTDVNAGFDTTFTPYTDGVVTDDIAALQISIPSVPAGLSVRVDYDMTMPSEGNGIVGSMMGAKYTSDGDDTETVLDSEATYVTKGVDTASIKVQKIIEGYAAKTAPLGVSLAGIEFKIKDSEGNYLKDGLNQDIIAETDAQGQAVFENLDFGTYAIEEVSSITGYKMDAKEIYVLVDKPEVIKIDAVNKPLPATLNIQKEWEDTNDQQGVVIFRVKRTSEDNIEYAVSVTTDETGLATIYGIPYGKYEIEEFSENNGWTTEKKNIIISDSTKNETVTNTLSHGQIVIKKTVPEGETVEGLKFQITGLGMVEYVNKEGITVNTNTDMTITIGQDYSAIPNINIEKSADNLNATITLSNLPMGSYTINEIEIPQITGKDIEKYVPVKQVANLQKNGDIVNVNILNKRKNGFLEIKKSAVLLNGEEEQEIGDLSEFKVKVEGTSDYGNAVNRIIPLDENGYAKIALEIGQYTVTEVDTDGYDVYYKVGGNLINSTTGTTVQIKYNETTKAAETTIQEIKNIHTGVGYVKVVKTLEGITDARKVKDAGIKFKVVGKNVAGGQVEEIINIDQIDLEHDVAYGVSGPISVGGDYELEEVDSTVPNYFEAIQAEKVDLRTTNTIESPLVISAEDKRAKGDLELSTKTIPEGGPLTGIEYQVTEIEIKDDGTYTKIGGTQKVIGSNTIGKEATAKLQQINAGNYLVEQTQVPSGWVKDVPQIVEVPSYSTGIAEFEITKPEEIRKTTLTISKQVLNEENEIASNEEINKAKLNEDESFEVKITNVDTNEQYYTFISGAKNGIIKGLEPGNYEIEEQYKMKYTTQGYYLVNEIEGEEVESEIEKANDKYSFTIPDAGVSESLVNIRIKNKINTQFKFGGTNLTDNLSKIDVEQDITNVSAKSIIYIVNEQGEALPGAQFKIIDSNGQEVVLGKNGNTYTTVERKIIIKGLESGEYTLRNISVPDGYLQPEDKSFTVYADAVRVARVEIQRNIPRGSLELATTYLADSGDTKYVSRSKYKVVNSETGDVVKFTKTNTGDYIASNLETALDTVSLKSGIIKLEGMKVGNYQIGMVDVADGFGLISTEPTSIDITEDTKQTINTQVTRGGIKQIGSGFENVMYLDYNGDMWGRGRNEYGELSNCKKIPGKMEFPNNTKISKFANGEFHVIAVDTEGKVWTWGKNYDNTLGIEGLAKDKVNGITCISELEGNPLKQAYDNGIKIVDVQATSSNSLVLDNQGKVWLFGQYCGKPTCLNDIEGNALNGVTIGKLGDVTHYYNNYAILDTNGYIWKSTYGTEFECISNDSSKNKYGVPMQKVVTYSMSLDLNNQVWVDDEQLPKSYFDGLDIIDIIHFDETYVAIDSEGKVWTWGNASRGVLGNGTDSGPRVDIPQCISKDINSPLYNVKAKKLTAGMYQANIVMLDSENKLWGWGGSNYYNQIGEYSSAVLKPQIIKGVYAQNLEYNLKFTKIDSYNGYLGISEKGELWISDITYQYKNIDNILEKDRSTELAKVYLPTNAKIVDASCGRNGGSMYAVDDEGKVWSFGEHAGGAVGDESKKIIEITDKFTSKIVKVRALDYNTFAALDENGKVWTSGLNGTGLLGDGTSTDNYTPTCISDNIDEELFNIKIVDMQLNKNRNGVIAVDTDGKVWAWGRKDNIGISTEKCETIEGYYTVPVCITNIENTELYNAYQRGIKIKKINDDCDLIDNTNMCWIIGQEHTYINTNEEEYAKLKNIEGLENVNIIQQCNDSCLLDDQGKIWSIDQDQNVRCFAEKIENPIYNKEVIDLDNDKYGRNYTINMDNEKILEMQNVYVKEDNIYKNIKSNARDSRIVLLDTTGKIWYWGGKNEIGIIMKHPVCLNNAENSILHNIEITKIITNNGKYIIAMDKNNKIWNIELLSDSAPKITCLNSDENSVLHDIIIQEQYIDANKIILLGTNGKIYVKGQNKYIGVDSSFGDVIENVICLNDLSDNPLNTETNNDSTFKITKMLKYDTSIMGLKDNKGRIWKFNQNSIELIYGGNSIKNVDIPKLIFTEEGKITSEYHTSDCVLTEDGKVYKNATELVSTTIPTIERFDEILSDGHFLYVGYAADGVWGWGYNRYSQLGVTTSSPYYQVPIKLISTQAKSIFYRNKTLYIIDINNKLWKGTTTGFKCITDTPGEALYNINVDDFVDIKIVKKYAYVKDMDNNIWAMYTNSMQKVENSSIGTETQKIYGEKTQQNIQNLINSINEGDIKSYVGVLVEYNNKIWKITENSGILTATECTVLNELKQSHNIVKYYNGITYYAIDSDGKLYRGQECISDLPDLGPAIVGDGWTVTTKEY